MSRQIHQGFTVVELLVAIVVGVLLLGSGYQLYLTVLRDSAKTQRRSNASNIAYDLLRSNADQATSPCTTKTASLTVPTYANPSSGTTANLAITCPYGTSSSSSVVTVTVTYFNPQQEQISRALTVHK